MARKKVKGTKQTFSGEGCDKEKKSINVRKIKCLNERQLQLQTSIKEKEITITSGLAGSGKTFLTLHESLNNLGGKYKKIVLVKSVTTLPDEDIGFLKGGMEEKMEPFMMSYRGNLKKLIGDRQTEDLFESGVVEVLPLAYIRGLSIDSSIVIIDEAQNLDMHTFKTIITRIGNNSKYIFMGDTDQIDRKDKNSSCLFQVIELFKDSDIVGTVVFEENDCVRNPIIPYLLNQLKTIEK